MIVASVCRCDRVQWAAASCPAILGTLGECAADSTLPAGLRAASRRPTYRTTSETWTTGSLAEKLGWSSVIRAACGPNADWKASSDSKWN
jgi:hypothetical protein